MIPGLESTPIETRIVFTLDARIADAYNNAMQNAWRHWVCFVDHDVFLANPHWYAILAEAVKNAAPSVGMFTCYTNRISDKTGQRHPNAPVTDDIQTHRAFARAVWLQGQHTQTPLTNASGMLMCIRREAWADVGGFTAPGFFKVDWTFSRALIAHGHSIMRCNGLYVYHLRDRSDGSWIEGVETSKEIRNREKAAKPNRSDVLLGRGVRGSTR